MAIKYDYKTVILQNVFKPVKPAPVDPAAAGGDEGRKIDEQEAENAFNALMVEISAEGWKIVSVNEIAGVIFYTLEREK